MSDDGRNGLTLIAFIGSVFSPYYARARRLGRGDPENHIALNVALYGAGGKRWTLTERGCDALARQSNYLSIGPSSLSWDGECLVVKIDEISTPIPSRVRGVVRLTPSAIVGQSFALDAASEHVWQPIAPVARVVADFDTPGLSWKGSGYFDRNSGAVPLEKSFACWDWSRASNGKRTTVLYDVSERTGGERTIAVEIDALGQISHISAPPRSKLPPTSVWRIGRGTRTDAGTRPHVVQTLEDTPFYARSLVSSTLNGEPSLAMHESLHLDRFTRPIVQLMLPFRMPRRTF